MGKLAVIADGKAHVTQAFQKTTGAEIERGVLPQRAHRGVEHGLDQIAVVWRCGRAKIADALDGVARGLTVQTTSVSRGDQCGILNTKASSHLV